MPSNGLIRGKSDDSSAKPRRCVRVPIYRIVQRVVMPSSMLRTFPTTIIVAALSLLAFVSPMLSQLWQLEFDAVAGGQSWRLLTGHLTHYGGGHLFWDLLMFVVLAAACEGQHRRLFAPSLMLMAAGISVSLALLRSDITVYRGLSGVDTGLFVWFVADQAIGCLRRREPGTAALWLLPAVAVCGKLIFEIATGQTLFVDSSHFTPLVESHLVGAAIGLALASWAAIRASRVFGNPTVARINGPASAAAGDSSVRWRHTAEWSVPTRVTHAAAFRNNLA